MARAKLYEVRRYGNYVNVIARTENSLRAFILDNIPPIDEEGGMLSDDLSTCELLTVAREQGYTFGLKYN